MGRLIRTGLNAGEGPKFQIVGGEGVYFVLDDGRRVLDASNTGGPLGHAHPDMVATVRRAATNPIVNEGWVLAEREAAADDVIDIAFAGEDWAGGVRFFLSGGEANDLALCLAQVLTGRKAFAARERAYHGMSGISQHLTLQPQWHGGLSVTGAASRPVPNPYDIRQIPAPVGAKYGALPDNRPLTERLKGVDAQLDGVAATILDYTQGGIYYDAAYQDQMAEASRRAGALWISDEVVTGTGRAGRMFAFQGAQSRPDMVTMGKGLAGGHAPIGAVVLSKEILDQMKGKSWQTYSTLRAHSLTMACVRTYLQVLKRDALVSRVAYLGTIMEHRLIEIARKHPSVARVDGNGLHWTVELHGPDWRTWENNATIPPIASRVSARALEAGALIGTSGEQISLFIAPAFTISEIELDGILSALDYGLELADEEMGRDA